MGVDPGTNLLGYSVIRTQGNNKKPILITLDVLDMRKMEGHFLKLQYIFNEMKRLITLYAPQEMAIEAPFYGKDAQAMLKLGRAQGAAITAAMELGVPITEYMPKSIKQSITGKGNASKEQIASMLPHLVEGNVTAKFFDATDALGVAMTHHFSTSGPATGAKKYNDWKDFVKDNPGKKL